MPGVKHLLAQLHAEIDKWVGAGALGHVARVRACGAREGVWRA
mgnify:CR=1 FL=1